MSEVPEGAVGSAPTTLDGSPSFTQADRAPRRTKDFGFLPILPHLRYHEDKPPKFGLVLHMTFVVAATFTVSNLYYSQPLLITLSKAFNVSYSEVSRIPTLAQAGYAFGLLFITPIGDLVHRRPLLLLLVLSSASISIGLATTNSVIVFETLSFLVGVVTVTPQVLLPLAADLAPPHRRASAMSIVLAGLLFGILLARFLSGLIGDFASWRNVFYMATSLQFAIWILLWFVVPDYPSKDPEIGYFGILRSMAWYAVSEPILVQACTVSVAASAVFSSFWVTLTFLLGGPPYHYSDLVIGIFGLIGIVGVATAPVVGRWVDKLIPWNASVLATLIMMVAIAVQTGAGGINVAAVVIACFGMDMGKQMQQVGLVSAIYAVEPKARARFNAVFIFSAFVGQIMGTASGTKVFVQYGWRATAGLSLAWMGFQLATMFLRGPHEPRKTWFGWRDGWSFSPRLPAAEREDGSNPQSDSDVQMIREEKRRDARREERL